MINIKHKLALAMIVASLGLAGCTEDQKPSTEESTEAGMTELGNKAGEMAEASEDKTGEMMETAKAKTADMKDAAEAKTSEMMDAAKEKTADMTEAGKDKLKEACIEMKKKTGGDESDC